MNILTHPWPWYITGPLIGLMIPLLLVLGNQAFGISSSLRHLCAMCIPDKVEYFKYNWKAQKWNLNFALGVIIGGFIGGYCFQNPDPIALTDSATESISKLGIKDFSGLVPSEIFNFSSLFTLKGFVLIVIGGFFVGFGTRYADGCTSGHSIFGISNLQLPSLIATCCFFAGGLIMTWLILPLIMNL